MKLVTKIKNLSIRPIMITIIVLFAFAALYNFRSGILWWLTRCTYLYPISNSLKADSEQIDALTFDPTGTILTSGSHDGTIRFWDASNFEMLSSMKPHDEYCVYEDVSPDCRFIIAYIGMDRKLALFSADNEELIHNFEQPFFRQKYLCFSPNGNYLVSFDDQGTDENVNLNIWSTSTGLHIADFEVENLYVEANLRDSKLIQFFSDNDRFLLKQKSNDPNLRNYLTIFSINNKSLVRKIRQIPDDYIINTKHNLILYTDSDEARFIKAKSLITGQIIKAIPLDKNHNFLSFKTLGCQNFIAFKTQVKRSNKNPYRNKRSCFTYILNLNNFKIVRELNNQESHSDKLSISNNGNSSSTS